MSKLEQRSALKSFLEAVLCKWLSRLLWVSLKMIDSLLNYRTALCMVMGQCSKSLEALCMFVRVSVSCISLESVFRIFYWTLQFCIFTITNGNSLKKETRGERERWWERCRGSDGERKKEWNSGDETGAMGGSTKVTIGLNTDTEHLSVWTFYPNTAALIVVYGVLTNLSNLK